MRTPAAKEEKQATAHVIRQKIPLTRHCQREKRWRKQMRNHQNDTLLYFLHLFAAILPGTEVIIL